MSLALLEWSSLSADERRAALRRPAQADTDGLHRRVREIIEEVRARGDQALLDFTERFDGVKLKSLEVDAVEHGERERMAAAHWVGCDRRQESSDRKENPRPRSGPTRPPR